MKNTNLFTKYDEIIELQNQINKKCLEFKDDLLVLQDNVDDLEEVFYDVCNENYDLKHSPDIKNNIITKSFKNKIVKTKNEKIQVINNNKIKCNCGRTVIVSSYNRHQGSIGHRLYEADKALKRFK